MLTFKEQLSSYGFYHRDRRNLAAHLLCMPMILVAVLAFLSRPNFVLDGVLLSPASAVIAGIALYYMALQRYYGVIMTALLLLAGMFATRLAAHSTGLWLWVSTLLLVVGVVLHRLGHSFEGTRHSFYDALKGIVIGPLALVVGIALLLGYDDSSRDELAGLAGRK
ncbi:MAG: hypothetical protein RLZZ450_6008 [Pseudomonadota bacterium]|jgi:uncharacterized membrane protein YGL010W